jgi:prepilin-type N-terminal cleavage/methylation domain-containing protein
MAKSSGPKRGFTMVEVIVAITVLNVMVAIFCQSALAHGQIVADLEEWCTNNPVYYVDPQTRPLARSLGWPADLCDAAPKAHWESESGGEYEVDVLSVTRDLTTLTTVARVSQRKGSKP